MMAKASTPAIAARGLNRDLGRAVGALDWVAVRSSVDGGVVDGGASVIVV